MITRHKIAGTTYWLNEQQRYHREDGPAIIWATGEVRYCIDGQTPSHMLNMIFLNETIDYDMCPSAVKILTLFWAARDHAYRISDPYELVLAILRHG